MNGESSMTGMIEVYYAGAGHNGAGALGPSILSSSTRQEDHPGPHCREHQEILQLGSGLLHLFGEGVRADL